MSNQNITILDQIDNLWTIYTFKYLFFSLWRHINVTGCHNLAKLNKGAYKKADVIYFNFIWIAILTFTYIYSTCSCLLDRALLFCPFSVKLVFFVKLGWIKQISRIGQKCFTHNLNINSEYFPKKILWCHSDFIRRFLLYIEKQNPLKWADIIKF